ncbi:hypothetical protein F5X68DRAFT_43029 [Plectosphaerella plurivora]|uniref:Uncharacterized protein n=1 Tax=Plectosphaerella plurivora TaxID=936078 RepID=A0A9P8V4E2_9PEZI|nr:hypothetical protein F5X68DRAFT_43029 [Plectosphaerella plurivora]
MATAIQPTEVDLSLDLSADTDFGEISYTDHEAEANEAAQQPDLDTQAPGLDRKEEAAGSLGVQEQVNIGSDVGDEFQEDYQYDDAVPQGTAEGGVQSATNDFDDEWDMEADADADDTTALGAPASEGAARTLDDLSAGGLDQGAAKEAAEDTTVHDGNEPREVGGYDASLGDISGIEDAPAQATEVNLPESGINDDFFQEINYEDDELAGSQSAGIEEPQGHDEEAVRPDDATAAATDQENSWLGDDETDKTGAIDEYHRSIQDQALDEILQADSSAVSPDTPVDGDVDNDGELPEVIVTWHGVNYPLFYDAPGSEGRQCFFEDTSLLQCAMEQLLASFRQELSSDLASTDELVLQINEMGLEFAESTDPEHYRDITLGSVMQVFNDLVKNKDPEASRPLYVYLITRTKCSTRWQSLIEDAYQGKNIDEVSIYFSMDQGTAEKELDHSESLDEGVEDQVDDMEMGEYFPEEAVSAGDSTAAADSVVEHTETAPDDGEQPHDELEAAEDDDDDHDNEQVGEDAIDNGEHVATESSASLSGEPERPETSIDDTLNEATLDEGMFNDDTLNENAFDEDTLNEDAPDEGMLDEDVFNEDDFNEAAPHEDMINEDALNEAAPHEDMINEDVLKEDVPNENTLNEEQGIQTKSTLETSVGNGDETTHDGQLDVPQNNAANAAAADAAYTLDDEPEPDSHDIFGLGETAHDNHLSETSGTATLDVDDGDHPGDFGADIDFNADISRDLEHDVAPATGQDELDEIDWRDYAGQDDDVQDASLKRPRSDEDEAADAEGGQEFKRRKSEA